MVRRAWLVAGALGAALLAAAAAASAHVCVLFLVYVSGPHVHVFC